jgi:hypothetical protein
MQEILNLLKGNSGFILAILGTIYVLASLIATFTPSDKDDTVIEKIGKFFDTIGFNLRKFSLINIKKPKEPKVKK